VTNNFFSTVLPGSRMYLANLKLSLNTLQEEQGHIRHLPGFWCKQYFNYMFLTAQKSLFSTSKNLG